MLARREILKDFAAPPLVGAPLAAVLANPTSARYDAGDAKQAWTLDFFGANLG